ncbi:MAG: EAL domain-containing protein [Bacilli bacterium]|nr:EAL domain-containing protein [Bacilli bacterium]
MYRDEILLVSNDVNKINKITAITENNFKLIVCAPNEAGEVILNNPLLSGVIYDIGEEADKKIRDFVLFRANHEDLQMVYLFGNNNHHFGKDLDPEGKFWCKQCIDSPAFKNKLLEFKEHKVSTASRMRLVEAIFDSSPVGIVIVPNNDLSKAIINDSFINIIGYTREEYLSIGWNGLTHPNDQIHEEEAYALMQKRGDNHFNLEKRIIRKDGSVVWIGEYMAIIPSPKSTNGEFVRLLMIRNIENRKVLEKELDESARSRSAILQSLPGLAYRCLYDENWTMEFVSAGAKDLTGYDADELLGNKIISFNNVILKKYRKFLQDEWDKVVKAKGVMQAEYEITAKDGTIKWVYERGIPIYDHLGNVVALEGIITDITKSKKLEKQLQYFHDFNHKLNLPNRELLANKIQAKLDVKNTKGTLFLVNLKDTQQLYRTHGYQYVELLTASLVNKLKTLETSHRALYYAEEDIYVYYSKHRMSATEINDLFRDIKNVIGRTIFREQIRCNVGVNHLSRTSILAESCLIRARIASENLQDETKLFNLNIYDDAMDKMVQREENLKKELIDLSFSKGYGNLRLVFQPIIDFNTGKICSFEALARYKSNKYGPVGPLEFIPIVEKNRIIVAFGKKIIDLAIIFIKRLMAAGIKNIPVAVNISALQLLDSDFTDDLLLRIESAGIPASLLAIEVTESIFSTNYNQLNAALSELNDYGIVTAIDDFGTGFSSLSRIEKLNFDTIKMDRTFIEPLNRETLKYSTVPEVINICKKFEINSLAEGIETKEQYDLLKELGCQYGQGYYMSRPLEEEDAFHYVLENR